MNGFYRFFILAAVLWPHVKAEQLPLSLQNAVERAVREYPSTRVSLADVAAADAAVQLARTTYLPHADFFAQFNRATRNNIYGMVLNQPYFSSISGPVYENNSMTSVWGSLTGVLVTWEPFDFGLRKANIGAAESEKRRAQAAEAATRFQVQAAAADVFLTILAAGETIKAAQAGVERARTLEQIVGSLVRAELRPGVDAERAKAERSLAEIQLVRAREAARSARSSLAQLLDVSPSSLELESERLLRAPAELPPDSSPAAAADLSEHPAAREQKAAVEVVQSKERALEKSYYPRFNLEGTTYGRGTGAAPDFTTRGGASGLGPNIVNWGVGMSVTFAAFDYASIRDRRKVESYREQAESARYDKVLRDLGGQLERASAQLESARLVADQAPVQLESARANDQQATARYKAGLGTMVEVAEAQRLLSQAEIDARLANLAVWRAVLALSSARGDLGPFLAMAGK